MEELAASAETEEDIPLSIRTRPVLDQFELIYWTAYQEVTGSRQFTSSGVAAIPYSEKVAWLNENGICDQDERNEYMRMITVLDNTYLECYYEKHKVT